jgi:hypothetical protein
MLFKFLSLWQSMFTVNAVIKIHFKFFYIKLLIFLFFGRLISWSNQLVLFPISWLRRLHFLHWLVSVDEWWLEQMYLPIVSLKGILGWCTQRCQQSWVDIDVVSMRWYTEMQAQMCICLFFTFANDLRRDGRMRISGVMSIWICGIWSRFRLSPDAGGNMG